MKKKIITLTCVLLIAIITGNSSCNKKTSLDPIAQAYWLNTMHTFTAVAVYVYLTNGFTSIQLDLPSENSTLGFHLNGTSTNTYTGSGTFSDQSWITLNKNGVNYSSMLSGGAASFIWSKRDDQNMWMEGTFTATLVNQTDPNDVLPITQGTLRAKFEF